jgi:anaerobic ribonucleoside-triphosphate reductase
MLEISTKNGTITVADTERQECEIWTRVMGYYRPVSEFNNGKKGEHAERVFFTEKKAQDRLWND